MTPKTKGKPIRKQWLPYLLISIGLVALLSLRRSNENDLISKRFLADSREGTISEGDAGAPSIAWLMTFPNSGTTYTTRLVQEVTGTATANNYGTVVMKKNNQFTRHGFTSKPVFQERPNGPYILPAYPMPLPTTFILTKTHCEGFCTDCSPQVFIKTFNRFMKGCHTGSKIASIEPETKQEVVLYDRRLVKKAVHLIRSPFENVVARFRHEINLNTKVKSLKYEFNAGGFKAWCKQQDDRYFDANKLWWMKGKELQDISKEVPCHADFFKYVQWHNYAFKTTDAKNLNLPSLVMHYEDYHYKFDETLDKLMDFLELERIYEPLEFFWHEYPEFYTKKERIAIEKFIHYFASPETKSHLGGYFTTPNNKIASS